MQRILDLADEYGAKLTFFPIGYQIPKQPGIWKEILDRGHEIENHSYHHLLVGSLTDEELYKTITMEERALNEVLGVNYKMKYFRPRGGSARNDPRLSMILHDLGYQAIASWGLSGGQDVHKLIRKSNGGHVVLFHTTDERLEKADEIHPGDEGQGAKDGHAERAVQKARQRDHAAAARGSPGSGGIRRVINRVAATFDRLRRLRPPLFCVAVSRTCARIKFAHS